MTDKADHISFRLYRRVADVRSINEDEATSITPVEGKMVTFRGDHYHSVERFAMENEEAEAEMNPQRISIVLEQYKLDPVYYQRSAKFGTFDGTDTNGNPSRQISLLETYPYEVARESKTDEIDKKEQAANAEDNNNEQQFSDSPFEDTETEEEEDSPFEDAETEEEKEESESGATQTHIDYDGSDTDARMYALGQDIDAFIAERKDHFKVPEKPTIVQYG